MRQGVGRLESVEGWVYKGEFFMGLVSAAVSLRGVEVVEFPPSWFRLLSFSTEAWTWALCVEQQGLLFRGVV